MDGLTRAFKKWSGFLPSDVIKKGLSKAFPKISILISIKGGCNMNYRVEKNQRFILLVLVKEFLYNLKELIMTL